MMNLRRQIIFLTAILFNASFVQCQLPWVPKEPKSHQQTFSAEELYEIASKLGQHAEFIYSERLAESLPRSILNKTVSPECLRDVHRVFNDTATGQLYALALSDSIGKQGSAFLDGNMKWYGSYEQCVSVRADETLYPEDAFNGKYCTFSFSSILVGICVPDTCSEADVQVVVEGYLDALFGLGPLDFVSVNCADPVPWRIGDTIMVVVTALFALLVLSSTGYEVYRQRSRKGSENSRTFINGYVNDGTTYEDDTLPQKETNGIRLTSISGLSNGVSNGFSNGLGNGYHGNIETASNGHLGNGITPENGHAHEANGRGYQKEGESRKTSDKKEKLSMKEEILQSFSVLTSGRKLVNMTGTPAGMRCLNGMRVLSMAWVVLGHNYAFLPEFSNNPNRFSSQVYGEIMSQFVIKGEVSVDTFFFLSGFLVAFGTLKMLNKTKGKMNWFLFYFNRYLRLTPVYMFVLFFMITLNLHMVSGPYETTDLEGSYKSCYEYWWTNLLYINTLYPESIYASCMEVTWYLSHDMIFFIVSPIFIYTLYRNKIAGHVLLFLGVLSNLITTAVTYITHNLCNPDEFKLEDLKYFSWIYFKPWYRFAPYLIGIACADLYMRTKDKVRNMKATWWKVFVVIMWGACIALNWALLYGYYPYSKNDSIMSPPWLCDMYASTFRTAWALTCAWVSFACLTGWGGIVNSLLSLKIWEPLCRLCYLAYLLHITVMYTVMMNFQQTLFINHWVSGFFFAAYLSVVFGLAVIFFFLVEQPLGTLQKIFFKK